MPHRLAALAIYGNILLVMLGLGVIAPNLNDIRQDFGVSYGAISWGVSAFAFARLLTNLPAGIAASRLPRLPLLLGGTLCVAVGSLIAALSTGLWAFLLARAVAGVGSSVCTTVGLTIVLDTANPMRRGRASGSFHSAIGGGALFGPGFGAVMSALGGWRLALLGAAGAALLSFVAVLLAYRLAVQTRAVSSAPAAAKPFPEPDRVPPLTVVFGVAFTAYIAAFAIFFVRGGVQQTVIPLMGRGEIGLSTGVLAALLMSAAAISSLLGPSVGGMSDRFGRSRVLMPGLAALALGCVAIGLAEGAPLFVAGMFLTALAGTTFSIPSAMIVDAVSESQRSFAIGIYRVVGDAAFTLAPFVSGFLMDRSGFLAASLASGATVLAAMMLGRIRGSRAASPVYVVGTEPSS